jgi:hypothetical protein
MPWKKMLAWVTGQIDDSLRQKLEFVLEENRVYRALRDRHSPQWQLQDAERKALAEKGVITTSLFWPAYERGLDGACRGSVPDGCGWQKPRHGTKSLILLDLSPS